MRGGGGRHTTARGLLKIVFKNTDSTTIAPNFRKNARNTEKGQKMPETDTISLEKKSRLD